MANLSYSNTSHERKIHKKFIKDPKFGEKKTFAGDTHTFCELLASFSWSLLFLLVLIKSFRVKQPVTSISKSKTDGTYLRKVLGVRLIKCPDQKREISRCGGNMGS